MTATAASSASLRVLVVEDDPETLQQFKETLPSMVGSCDISWVFCPAFDEAIALVRTDRFDVIATDIYRDREGVSKENLEERDQQAREILDALRGRRFTPVVVFSDSSLPVGIEPGPFVLFADKSSGNDPMLNRIQQLIETGVPEATRELHDELDAIGGDYLWGFLQARWEELTDAGLTAPSELRRIVRRRAATAFGRLDPHEGTAEREEVDGIDFYLYPRIASRTFRLGDVIRRTSDMRFGVVLTPHCHLAIQQGAEAPRAESAIVSWANPADEILASERWENREDRRHDDLRRRTQSPAAVGKPRGRYWFLPPFLDIPASYCDLMELEPLSLSALEDNETYQAVATLDAPFAEALQSSFIAFYSAVGIPSLRLDPLLALIPTVAK